MSVIRVKRRGQGYSQCNPCAISPTAVPKPARVALKPANIKSEQPAEIALASWPDDVQATLASIHTIVCLRQAEMQTPLDPLQCGGDGTHGLFQQGDPGFHVAGDRRGLAGSTGMAGTRATPLPMAPPMTWCD
jgi:hypothetical protein